MIEKIWHKFHQQLLAFIISKVTDKACAEDILQDVFIKVIKSIQQLQDDEKLQSWLYQICRHSIIDYYRNKPMPANNEILDSLIAEDENHQQQAQLSRCILTLINQLPDDMSQILVDSELEQNKQKDIAQKYRLTLPATKSRIQRGRILLKKKLMACCEFEFNEDGPEAQCNNQCGCSD